MNESTLSEAARKARAAYKREWTRKNPEKNKEYVARYWERRAKKSVEQKKGGEHECHQE